MRTRALAVAAGCAMSVGAAQAQFTVVNNIPGAFTDISATGTFLGNGDDASFAVAVSAAVANAAYPTGTLQACTNGNVGYVADNTFTNATIPSPTFHAGGIAGVPFWDDLITTVAGTGLYAQTIGNTLIIQWHNFQHYPSSPSTCIFQMKIFGGGSGPNGALAQFIYQDVDFGDANNNGASATIGHQVTGATGFQYSFNTPSIQNGAVLSVVFDGPTGACCIPATGACVINTQNGCTTSGGVYRGDGTTCPANCPQPPTGACCRFDGSCSVVTPAVCSASGGNYRGDGTVCGSCPQIPPVIISNCNLGTGPTTLSGQGGLPAGTQWSECARDANDPTTANTTAGFGGTGALRLADDFVVPAGGLNLAYVRFPVYLTGSPTVSVTALTLQIWNGPPNAGGTVIFGDPTTNRMANAEFAPYFRCFNTVTPPACGGATTAPDQNRHIQWAYAAVNQMLPAGTYWLDWNFTGASFAPCSTAQTAIGRQCNPNNANALQFNGGWVACADVGQGCAPTPVNQDMYFEILGTTGSTCYPDCDQSHSLNVNDFVCFQGAFAAGNLAQADCDHSNTLNVNDFVCFQSAFAAGCSQL